MLKENGVQVMTSSRVVEINDQGVVVEGHGRKTIPADHVLVAIGLAPCRSRYARSRRYSTREPDLSV